MADRSHLELPPIAMTASDRARLGRLAQAALERFPEAAEFLAREVERASVVADGEAPERLVRMGSQVEFRDDATGLVREVHLVYPEQADVSAAQISILTPVGAALIGLTDGQCIAFQTPNGEQRSLTVLAVRKPS
jgi:regulator of nucleoside diphosphate kinase